MSRRPRLIVIGPLPPPVHGVTVSTSLVLANPILNERFRLEHLDTSDHRADIRLGRWDVRNVTIGLANLAGLLRRLRGEPGVVYLPLSQSVPAFLRDAFFIHCASAFGWSVAAHLRGGEFHQLYAGQGPLFRLWARLTLRRVDSMAVMGSSLTGVFDGLVPSERLVVVPNGTPDPGTNGDLRAADTVLFLSNLRRRKGVVESVETALLVAERHPSARFLFAGKWEDRKLERCLRNRAAAAGDRIRFLPPADAERQRELLSSASIFLFPPSEPEGHPRVVLEALAAGLPVVTTDRGAIAETVVDGETGFVLPDPDPEQLAERVLRLLDDDDLRDRVSRAARASYLERFTQEHADRSLAGWLLEVAR